MFTDLIEQHYRWVHAQGWLTSERPLELLMLIVSEVGEAANECRGEKPSERFRLELADIVLRTGALARWYEIDLEAAMEEKIRLNQETGNRGRLV